MFQPKTQSKFFLSAKHSKTLKNLKSRPSKAFLKSHPSNLLRKIQECSHTDSLLQMLPWFGSSSIPSSNLRVTRAHDSRSYAIRYSFDFLMG